MISMVFMGSIGAGVAIASGTRNIASIDSTITGAVAGAVRGAVGGAGSGAVGGAGSGAATAVVFDFMAIFSDSVFHAAIPFMTAWTGMAWSWTVFFMRAIGINVANV